MIREILKEAGNMLRGAEQKVSAAGSIISMYQVGKPTWMKNDTRALAEEGFSRNAIVFRCVTLISSAFGSIPLTIMDGKKEVEEETHPFRLLLDKPNPMRTGSEFREDAAAFLLIQGDEFLEQVGPNDETAPPLELWNQRPDRMEVIAGPYGMPMAYRYVNGSANKTWKCDPSLGTGAIIHWKTFAPLDDWRGMSPIRAAAYAVDQHNEASAWNKAMLENGARPSGALVYAPEGLQGATLSDEQYTNLNKELDNKLKGAKNAARPMILDGGLTWQAMGLNPVDMDWLEGKNMSAREICNIYGVPPQLAGVPGESTFNNMETARLMLYEDVVIPLARKFRDKINQTIAIKFGDKIRVELDLDKVPALAPRRKEQMDQLSTCEFLTINEKRAALEYDELDIPEADQIMVSAAMVPLEGAMQRTEDAADAENQATLNPPQVGPDGKPKPGSKKPTKPGAKPFGKSNDSHDELGRFATSSGGSITVHSVHSSRASAHAAGMTLRRAGHTVFRMTGAELSQHNGVEGLEPDSHYVYSHSTEKP